MELSSRGRYRRCKYRRKKEDTSSNRNVKVTSNFSAEMQVENGSTGTDLQCEFGPEIGAIPERMRTENYNNENAGIVPSSRHIVPHVYISRPTAICEGPLPISRLLSTIDSVSARRAGVIPYTTIGSSLYFCLGIDTVTGDYTDFGGGYSSRRDSSPVATAIRELNEESQKIFNVNHEQLERGWYLRTYSDLILFMGCRSEVALASSSLFRQKVKSALRPEVRGIVWINSTEMMLELQGSKFYSRVRDLLLPKIEELIDLLTYESYYSVYNIEMQSSSEESYP